MMEALAVYGIYIVPTISGIPPRAILINKPPEEEGKDGKIPGVMAVWTADVGCWTLEGVPLPQELGDALTERARELGVESFL